MEKEEKIKKPRGTARLKEGHCIGCGDRCEGSCPVDAIQMDDNSAPLIDAEKCIGCVKCVKICPAEAIELFYTAAERELVKKWEAQNVGKEEELSEKERKFREKLAQYRGVWVLIEQTDGEAAKVSWELLGTGAELAEKLQVELSAVIIGHEVEHLCDEAFSYGAQKVYIVDAPVYENYRTEPYNDAMVHLIEEYKPEIILMGATGLGRDLAGAVATVVKTGLTADCTGLDIDDKRNLMQTRPAFGGNIMATIMCDHFRPQMATVRPHVMKMPEKVEGSKGEIVRDSFAPDEEGILTKVLEVIRSKDADKVDIGGAEIIVSGGRGLMNKENFAMLQELADELGGVVGASRSAVDAGWMPHDRQVGQTGKTVRPKIYLACGISGAIQHRVGMQDSDIVIAINRDKEAPIFTVSTYGIVGDIFKIVPALTQRVRELKKAGSPGTAA